MKRDDLEKKLTFAVALGREEQELRLVAAIFLSSARPQHFVLEASEDSIRLRMRLSTNRGCGGVGNWIDWAGPNLLLGSHQP